MAYDATLYFSNSTTGVVRARSFQLQVVSALVQNGGFETGTFSGWTLSGNTSQSQIYVTGVAHSGSDYAVLEAFRIGGAIISQTLPTIAGQAYQVSFWLKNTVAGSSASPNQLQVNWNTATTIQYHP